MNYTETVNWLYAQLPMFQNSGKKAYKADLSNIQKFVEYLSLSTFLNVSEQALENQPLIIHVAGTNGKGSTCHMLSSVLQEAGYKVGLFTSPHLKSFTERIRVNGEECSENFIVNFVKEHSDWLKKEKLSFFEMCVGMAFSYFKKEDIDVMVVETGLGGRLDATNVVNPVLSIITNIGLDHTHILGDSLDKIAFEKAGIIKNNTPVVIGDKNNQTQQVFEKVSKERKATIYWTDKISKDYTSDLKGTYQKKNIKAVLKAIEVLENKVVISENNIRKGLLNVVQNTGLKGRWQVLGEKPFVVCDTAHNPMGVQSVVEQIQKQDYKRLHLILGFVNDKDVKEILKLFPWDAQYYLCKPNLERGMELLKLQSIAEELNLKYSLCQSVEQALELVKSNALEDDFIYIGGSTFIVAEII